MSQVVIIEDPATLRIILDLADHPWDVKTTMDYGPLAVIIPDDLYAKFQAYGTLSESESSPPVEPKKRGPGRPRKYQLPGLE